MWEYVELNFDESLALGLGGLLLFISVALHSPKLIVLGLVYLVIWLISQIVYYVRLILVVIKNGRTGTPDPEVNFEKRLHLNLT